jgi:hypothetical protein
MALMFVAERARHPQRGARRANCDRDRGREPHRLIVDGRRHAQRRHPCVVHAGDTDPHHHAARQQPARRQALLGRHEERQIRSAYREGQRTGGRRGVVAERDRQREREHRDEVHRPDADAERERTAEPPRMPPACRPEQEDAARQIERGVRRERRDRERNRHEP